MANDANKHLPNVMFNPSTVTHSQESPTDNSPDISRNYIECLEQFRTLFMLIDRESQRAAVGLEDINLALEEYGRLQTWGEETRAALPANARGSLDDTLRKDNALKDAAIGTLIRLQRQVQIGK